MNELHLTKKDFRLDWFSGTGAGGQYRNKHQNCCRLVHIETGIITTGQSHRERPANQKEAFEKMVKLLLARQAVPESRNHSDDIVRTYHFERNSVSDGIIEKPIKQVMNGDIEDFIKNALHGQRPIRKSGRV